MSRYDGHRRVEEVLGKTATKVTQHGDASIHFTFSDGSEYEMVYEPDCCASASIEDVAGDLQDLVGAPLLMSEEVTNSDDAPPASDYAPESYTWTYYKFATVKGYVTIRWFGSSNGYYSETASFNRLKAPQ
jgi:hypothetical protein